MTTTAAPDFDFSDGAAYERMMGTWSRLVGARFLDWLAPAPGLRWLDVGCGNGAFTALVLDNCAPGGIDGIDPSEEQLAFAEGRCAQGIARFRRGDALALPFPGGAFDVAVMALVIFFVPDPARAVAEMRRVVRPGGTIAAYAWDVQGGGLPLEDVEQELRALGVAPVYPPQVEYARIEALRGLWQEAGLTQVQTRAITVERSFADFEDLWLAHLRAPPLAPLLAAMPADTLAVLKQRLRARLPTGPGGSITQRARANAVMGRVPG